MPLLLSLAWRYSASKRQRSLLTVLAIALGVGMILGTGLTSEALRRQLQESSRTIVGRADAEVFAFGDNGFSPAMLDAVKQLPQVDTAAPVASKRLTGILRGTSVTFHLLGIDPAAAQRLHPLVVTAGRGLDEADAFGVLLESDWAAAHAVRVGDQITLFTALGPDLFRVRGLLRDPGVEAASFGATVVVPLPVAEHALRLGARITQVSVSLRGGASAFPAFRAALRQVAVEEYTVRDNLAFAAGRSDPYAELRPVLSFFSLMALAIGLFLIYNDLAVTVLERRREIGLLRAAGATSDFVRQLFMVQAGILGLAGSLAGLGVGYVVSLGLVGYLSAAAGRSGLQPGVDILLTVGVVLLGFVATLVCAIIPAQRAARLAPLEAIRPQGTVGRARRRWRALVPGVLLSGAAAALLVLVLPGMGSAGATAPDSLRLLESGAAVVLVSAAAIALTPVFIRPLTAVVQRPLAVLFPGESQLARNALIRQPGRSALTIAGLLVASALVVSVGGLASGALAAGESWVNSLFVADEIIVSPVHQSDQIREAIGRMPGVAGTSPVSFFALRSGDRAVSLAAIDVLDYSARAHLEFDQGDRQAAFTQLEEGRALFISDRLAAARHWGVGQRLTLASGPTSYEYRVAAVLRHSLPSPGGEETALISLANARQDYGVTGFNLLQVIPTSSAGPGIEANLREVAQRYGMDLQTVPEVRAGVRRGINSILFLLSGIGLVGILLGLMSIVTTILINISESSREFGLLRAVGMTRGGVRRVIGTQASMLGFSGALAGVLVGLVLTAVVTASAATPGFQPDYTVPWGVIFAVVAVALVGSALAVLLPARGAARRSVVESLRFE